MSLEEFEDADFSPQLKQAFGVSSSGERSSGEHEGRGRRQRRRRRRSSSGSSSGERSSGENEVRGRQQWRRRHRSSSSSSSRERSSSSSSEDSSKRDWSPAARARGFTGALHGQQWRPFPVPSNTQYGSADDTLPRLNAWIAANGEKMWHRGLDSSPLTSEDLRTVPRLVSCCYDLLPPGDRAQLVQQHGSEEAARAWVAEVVQETIIVASRAALCATHGHLAWLQGAHAVLPLGSLSAGAQAAAAAGHGSRRLQRRLLQLVVQVLDLVMLPAAELCAGLKVDSTSNNGVLLYPGGNLAGSMHRDGSEGPRLVDSLTVIPRTDAPPDSCLALGTNSTWNSCLWRISGALVMSYRIRTQGKAKFAHARVSNGTLDLTLRFTYEAGSQADPPPLLPGLLKLLQELAPHLLDPAAKAALRDPRNWEPTAMGGGDFTARTRAAQRAAAAAAATSSPRAARPRHVDLRRAMAERETMGIAGKKDLQKCSDDHYTTLNAAWSGMGLPAGQRGGGRPRIFLVPAGDADAAVLHQHLVAADSELHEGQLAAFSSAPAALQRQLALQLALRAASAAATSSPRAARPRHVDLRRAMAERETMGITGTRDLQKCIGAAASRAAWSGMGLPAGERAGSKRIFLVPADDADAAVLHQHLVAADSELHEGQLAAFSSAPAALQRQLALQLALRAAPAPAPAPAPAAATSSPRAARPRHVDLRRAMAERETMGIAGKKDLQKCSDDTTLNAAWSGMGLPAGQRGGGRPRIFLVPAGDADAAVLHQHLVAADSELHEGQLAAFSSAPAALQRQLALQLALRAAPAPAPAPAPAAATESPRAARPRHVDLRRAMADRETMGITGAGDLQKCFGAAASRAAWSGMGLPAGERAGNKRIFLVPAGDADAAVLHQHLVAADSELHEGQLAAFSSAPAALQRQLALQLALRAGQQQPPRRSRRIRRQRH